MEATDYIRKCPKEVSGEVYEIWARIGEYRKEQAEINLWVIFLLMVAIAVLQLRKTRAIGTASCTSFLIYIVVLAPAIPLYQHLGSALPYLCQCVLLVGAMNIVTAIKDCITGEEN